MPDNNQEANEHGVRRISPATSGSGNPVKPQPQQREFKPLSEDLVRTLTRRQLELLQAMTQVQDNFNSLYSRYLHSERMTTEICSRAVARIDEQEQRLIAQATNLLELTGLCETLLERLELCEVQLSRMNYYMPVEERESFYEVPEAGLTAQIKKIVPFGRGK